MSEQGQPKGQPIAIEPQAKSASPTEPAFVAPPEGSPVYHGFVVLEDVNVEGFIFGAITDFEKETSDAGDAFVIAPDGNRAGLVWEVSSKPYIKEVCPFEQSRWGVWAVSFPFPMKSRDNARDNLTAVLPELKMRWGNWKRWLSQINK